MEQSYPDDDNILIQTQNSESEVIHLDGLSTANAAIARILELAGNNENVTVTLGGIPVIVTELAEGKISVEIPQLAK